MYYCPLYSLLGALVRAKSIIQKKGGMELGDGVVGHSIPFCSTSPLSPSFALPVPCLAPHAAAVVLADNSLPDYSTVHTPRRPGPPVPRLAGPSSEAPL
jgi:hypothetical protein